MKLSLTDACEAFADLQARVHEATARLRRARADPHASRALPALQMLADRAVVEYRDASPRFAFVLSQFPAANDDIGNDVAEATAPRQGAALPLKTER